MAGGYRQAKDTVCALSCSNCWNVEEDHLEVRDVGYSGFHTPFVSSMMKVILDVWFSSHIYTDQRALGNTQ